jgi:hypothetical protein
MPPLQTDTIESCRRNRQLVLLSLRQAEPARMVCS